MRLTARWVRESRSLALRGRRTGWLIGLADGRYIIQTALGEAEIDSDEAATIELQLSRDPAGKDPPYAAVNDPEMAAYIRKLDPNDAS
jgi:hypothetical protein